MSGRRSRLLARTVGFACIGDGTYVKSFLALALSLCSLPSYISSFLCRSQSVALVVSSLSAPFPWACREGASERASERDAFLQQTKRFTTMSVCSHSGTTICREKEQGYATQEKHVWYADKMQMHNQGICLCCFLIQYHSAIADKLVVVR